MDNKASDAALVVSAGVSNRAIVTEEDAKLIAESIDWSAVEQVAKTCPHLPAQALAYVSDKQARERARAGLPATVALMNDIRTIDVVMLEANAPRYLELPAVVAALAVHPEFLAARPLGRLMYRDAMYEQGEYCPLCFERKEVLDLVHQMVCPKDKRVAVAASLAGRVGIAVGFLSGLAVAQSDEAQNGMTILAALVAPLLRGLVAPASGHVRAGARSLPAPRKQKSKR